MNRRNFISKSLLVTGATVLPEKQAVLPFLQSTRIEKKPTTPVSKLKKPLAIAMWDYSWILRHHRYGEFENWDQTLSELAERGYDAIRIDVMPQFVARDPEAQIITEFRSVKTGWTPSLWGNDYTMTFSPREALLEFLPLCQKYNIKVGLSSWFMRHGTDRTAIFMEEGGLLRAWDETLAFLQSHNLLGNVIYVDLLNEYPNWHGYDWLKDELNKRSDINKFKLDHPEANVPDSDPKKVKGNPLKQQFYNDFINTLIRTLKQKYPSLDFFASLDSSVSLDSIDLSNFGALDYHVWFAHHGSIPGLNEIRSRDQSQDYKLVYSNLEKYWRESKGKLVQWMDKRITDIANTAAKNNMNCGNTEGWGPIWWMDHPELDWRWVKETADICVDLSLKHDNYKFICTSNFTHPQFKGMWDDVKWHQRITSKIKNG